MRRLFPIVFILAFSLIFFSCSTIDKPRAEIEGEIVIIAEEPGIKTEITIPLEEEPLQIIEDPIEKEETSEKTEEMEVPPSPDEDKTIIGSADAPTEIIISDSPIETETKEMEDESSESTETREETESIVIIGGADSSTEIFITDTPTDRVNAAENEVESQENTSLISFNGDDMISLFNYAYGLKTMDDIKSENISLDAQYFSRAVLDASLSPVPTLVSSSEIQTTIDKFVLEYYYEGKTFEPGERPSSISELYLLEKPDNLEKAFSYAYTFSIIRELIDGEVDIIPESFILGALDSLMGDERLLDNKGVENAINNYINYLNEEYLNELEKKGENNSNRAKEFMSLNGKREGIVTLESGIQLMILDEDDTLGPNPTQYDTVIVDYNMYVMDYETEELEIIDADYYAELRLIEVDTALQASIVALRVGQAGRTWIPPELLYGERNIEGIEPNSIIVYDIALHSIL